MFALVLIGLGATLLYLSNQNQQILAKPLALSFALTGASLCLGGGLFYLSLEVMFLVALFQAIAMISLVFMLLPVFGGFYANNRLHQSLLLNTGLVDMGEGLANAQKYH